MHNRQHSVLFHGKFIVAYGNKTTVRGFKAALGRVREQSGPSGTERDPILKERLLGLTGKPRQPWQ